MSGVEKIKKRILEDAQMQAQKNTDDARNQAEDIIKVANQKAQERKNQILENAKIEAADRKKRMIAVAQLEARKQRLKAKQEIIEKSFEMALNKLNKMPKDMYQNVIMGMIINSVPEDKEVEIILSKEDRSKISSDFITEINEKLKNKKTKVMLSEDIRDMSSGFILKVEDIEVNNSFESMIRMQRDELEMEIVKVLF